MKTPRICWLVLLVTMPVWALAQDEQTLPGRGMKPLTEKEVMPLVRVCESCHGAGGQTTRLEVPPLAGKSADYILSALEEFYYYERHCPDIEFENDRGEPETRNMCDVVNGLTREEALALGRHFEMMPPTPAEN